MTINSIDLLAVAPCDVDRAVGLAKEIGLRSQTIPVMSNAGRLQLLKVAKSLTRALETPMESIGRSCWVEPTLYAAINTVVGLDLFSLMAKNGDTTHVKQLADTTGVEYDLISRLLKHVAAMEVVLETAPDEYKLTNFSKTLTLPKYADGFPCMQVYPQSHQTFKALTPQFSANAAAPALYKLQEYLSKNGYRAPTDAENGAFQYAYNTKLNWFSWLKENPSVYKQFNNHMTAYREGRPSWMDPDFYPVQQQLVKGACTDPKAAFMVDVGGGLGQDLVEFHQKHPNIPGRLVVQDLPEVVETIQSIDKAIEPMAHNFFNEQPVKGARAYYLHSVLHNWPDDACVRILSQIAAAMTPDYSRILISEPVIPAEGADPQMTGLDLMMMTLYGAKERKKSDWVQLIGEAGLRIRKIWNHEDGFESLIECELA